MCINSAEFTVHIFYCMSLSSYFGNGLFYWLRLTGCALIKKLFRYYFTYN